MRSASRQQAEAAQTVDRPPAGRRRSISAEDIRQDTSYLIVAERTNTNGSRQFKRLLEAEDWDGMVVDGRG